MRKIFVDTVFWLAYFNRKDQWHESAQRAFGALPAGVGFVTTEEVLTEFLANSSAPGLRVAAAGIVRRIMSDPQVEVAPQEHMSFVKGLELYEKRGDKGYSLVDCISMNVMKTMSITDALTRDRHFAQESFNVLMQ